MPAEFIFGAFDPRRPVGYVQGGNLPHWRQDGATYFVTWRTADSIPAGLAISHQLPVLLTANLFALLGLRPLYQLIVIARARLRYINQTIAVLLLLAALKLLSSDIVHVGPAASLIVVGTAFAIGAAVSLSARRA